MNHVSGVCFFTLHQVKQKQEKSCWDRMKILLCHMWFRAINLVLNLLLSHWLQRLEIRSSKSIEIQQVYSTFIIYFCTCKNINNISYINIYKHKYPKLFYVYVIWDPKIKPKQMYFSWKINISVKKKLNLVFMNDFFFWGQNKVHDEVHWKCNQ